MSMINASDLFKVDIKLPYKKKMSFLCKRVFHAKKFAIQREQVFYVKGLQCKKNDFSMQ